MNIDTHGLKIDLDSLIKAANDTADWPENTGRTDIHFDMDDGAVWCTPCVGDHWGLYDDSVITVTRTTKRRSAQWIADRIYEALGE